MPGKWSEEAREAARKRCLETQPWKFSTGPKTAEGKRKSSQNSWRHGLYGKYFQAVFRYSLECERLQKEVATGNSVRLTLPQIPNEMILAVLQLRSASQSQVLEQDFD